MERLYALARGAGAARYGLRACIVWLTSGLKARTRGLHLNIFPAAIRPSGLRGNGHFMLRFYSVLFATICRG